MSEPSPAVVAEVEAFCDRHEADPTSLELSGLRFLTAPTRRSEQLGTFDGSSRTVISWFLTGH
jgi:hypothetical protein